MPTNNIGKGLHIACPSPEHPFTPAWTNPNNINLWVKRDDLLHPIISGNKWRKLRQALEQLPGSCDRIISFGGGYSNHIHALAFCCQKLGIPLHAIIRGDYSANPSPMLQDIQTWGSTIEYVNKLTYQQRHDPAYLQQLEQRYPDAVIIPEGGSQQQALAGMADMLGELTQTYDYILAPVASGGTLAGIIHGLTQTVDCQSTKVIGIGVLKGQGYLENLVSGLLPLSPCTNWHIEHDFHFGGYAKSTDALLQFCQDLNQQYQLPLEPVYSGKLFWAVRELLAKGIFPPNSKILLLHTGGLQGARKLVLPD